MLLYGEAHRYDNILKSAIWYRMGNVSQQCTKTATSEWNAFRYNMIWYDPPKTIQYQPNTLIPWTRVLFEKLTVPQPILVAVQSKDWFCGRLLPGTVGSNPAGGMDVSLLWVLCVVRQRSLCQAEHWSRGALPSVVCLSVIMNPR